jgi:cytochrome d ubiquinol oxidase subunit II
MMTPEGWIALVMLGSLTLYMLSAGADFGGGLWELFATGPRAGQQRKTIEKAIAPIWEANHVWLIIVVVLLFGAFPPAFAMVMTALHIPMTIMLVGIVLRGSAFVFRAYGDESPATRRRWTLVFAVSSIIAPLMLGISLGAISSGSIGIDSVTGRVTTDFVSSWLAPFPIAVGLLTVCLCAFLAAVYLTLETDDPDLKSDFRRRALFSSAAVFVVAWATFFLSREGAPRIHAGLSEQAWSLPLQIGTGLAAVGAIAALWTRRFRLARRLAVAQVGLIVVGWGVSQYPYLVPPDLTIAAAAASLSVLKPMLGVLSIGLVILVPAFWYLYAVFKRAG